MPIKIYNEENQEEIAWLCDTDWELPTQISELESWLNNDGINLRKGKYVADIGFDIRKDANGGGGIINSKMMKIMADIGMEIYLSEYPKMKK